MAQDDIVARVRAALERDTDINLHEYPITVTNSDGLALDGEVEHIIAKRKAVRLARQAARADSVLDRLRIRPAWPRGDRELRDHVLAHLREDPAFGEAVIDEGLDAAPEPGRPWIGVTVADGIVRLEGEVGSLSHRRLAEVILWWLPGTRDVDNRLHVSPPERETDDEVTDVIRQALEKDPNLHHEDISVTTRDKTVTLRGTVHSAEQRRLAVYDCWYVPGVHEVRDELSLRGA